MNKLGTLISRLDGGVTKAASVCGVSERAVYKWIERGRLPRTDFTGETHYAKKLEEASGGTISAFEFLQRKIFSYYSD